MKYFLTVLNFGIKTWFFSVFKLFFHHNKKSCVQLVSKLAFFRTRRHCRTRYARATNLTTSAEKRLFLTLVAQIAIVQFCTVKSVLHYRFWYRKSHFYSPQNSRVREFFFPHSVRE